MFYLKATKALDKILFPFLADIIEKLDNQKSDKPWLPYTDPLPLRFVIS